MVLEKELGIMHYMQQITKIKLFRFLEIYTILNDRSVTILNKIHNFYSPVLNNLFNLV